MFVPGSVVTSREVWGGRAWLSLPMTVVSDDEAVLALRIDDGAPFTFDGLEPAHPWSGRAAWSGATVLQLRRTDTWYSVWKFFEGDDFTGWYVNFERPVSRRPDGVETDDLELDLVVTPDGDRHWKDVEHLHARLAERRFAVDDLVRVLEAAAEVTDRLDRDDRWWAPWDDWVPAPAAG